MLVLANTVHTETISFHFPTCAENKQLRVVKALRSSIVLGLFNKIHFHDGASIAIEKSFSMMMHSKKLLPARWTIPFYEQKFLLSNDTNNLGRYRSLGWGGGQFNY